MDFRNTKRISVNGKSASKVYVDNKLVWQKEKHISVIHIDFDSITKLTDNVGYIYYGPKGATDDPSEMSLSFTTDIAPSSGNNILFNFDPTTVETVSDSGYEGRIPFTFDPGLSSSGVEGIDRNAKYTLNATYNNITTSKQIGVRPTWVMDKIWFSELEQFAEIDNDGNIKLQVSYSPIGGLLQAGGNEYGDFTLTIDNYDTTDTLNFIPGDIKIDSIYWQDHDSEYEDQGVLRWYSYTYIYPYGYDKLNPYPPVTKVEHTPNGTAIDITIDNVSITKLGFTKFDCDHYWHTSTDRELCERTVYFNPIKITDLHTSTRGWPTSYQGFNFYFEGVDDFHDNYRLRYYDCDGYPKFTNRIEDQQYNAMPKLYYTSSYQSDPHIMEIDVSKWYVDEINPNNEYNYDFSAIILMEQKEVPFKTLPMKFDFRSGNTDNDLKKEVRQ